MGRNKTLLTLWIIYCGTLGAIAFWPSPIDRDYSGILNRLITALNHQFGLNILTYSGIEFVANILLFIPLGVLIWASSINVNSVLLLAVSFAGILSIEFFQKVLLEERYASALDLLANSCGVLIGFWITTRFHKFTEKTQPRG